MGCRQCGEDRDHYLHKPATECARRPACRSPEDHHEYLAPTAREAIEEARRSIREALSAIEEAARLTS